MSSPSLDEEPATDLVAANRSEHALSQSWTGSQISMGADSTSAITGFRQRRPNSLQMQPVPRDSDTENQDLVEENRVDDTPESESPDIGRLGSQEHEQQVQHRLNERIEESLATPPPPALPYWQFLGLRKKIKRLFYPPVAKDSQRIEWICVSNVVDNSQKRSTNGNFRAVANTFMQISRTEPRVLWTQ